MTEDKKSSQVSGFYKKSIEERIEFVKNFSNLTDEETKIFSSALDMETADRMIENVLGTFELHLGIAVNFHINGKEYLIPRRSTDILRRLKFYYVSACCGSKHHGSQK